jgi:hypothetical protein
MEDEYNRNEIHLELGDIITIYAPTNPQLHHNAFFIKYIDDTKIKLIDTSHRNIVQLNLDENKQITDESITQIRLKSRSKEKGFARQFGLLPDTWINIHFGGEFPRIDVGKITNLEEDMIEVTIVPDNVIYYIDFEYKGMPEYLPIEKIVVRSKPSFLGNKDVEELVDSLSAKPKKIRDSDGDEDGDQDEVGDGDGDETEEDETKQKEDVETSGYGEGDLSPINIEPEEFIPNLLTAMYLDADEIFEENLGEITQMVEVSEREKRHTLEMQITNIADKLLAKVPVSARTGEVAHKIQNIIDKFKQLRVFYSVIDENNNVVSPVQINEFSKPVVEKLKAFNERLRWIIPVVSNRKIIFGNENGGDGNDETDSNKHDDYTIVNANKAILTDVEIQETYANKRSGRGERELKYDKMMRDLYSNGTVYDIPSISHQQKNHLVRVNDCIESIIEHLDEFKSYTVGEFTKSRDKGEDIVDIKTEQFIMSRFCGPATKIKHEILKSGKKVQQLENITEPDPMYVKSLVVMPKQVIHYSRVDLPATKIITRSELAMTEMHMHRVLRNSADCDNVIVYDLEKQIDYEKDDDGVSLEMADVFNKMKKFMVDDELAIRSQDDFDQFLNVIFPNIRVIIKMMEKQMAHSFSFIQVLENIEPFAVYSHNVSFHEYNEIRHFLKEKIKKYKSRMNETSKEYNYYSSGNLKMDKLVGNIAGMFADKTNYNEWFKNAYDLTLEHKTGTELIQSMLLLDHGKFYSKLIMHRMLELFTPDNIMKIIESSGKDGHGDDDDGDKGKIGDKCGKSRKTIAKKYSTVAYLQKDNGKEDIYFDKEFDDTPYHLLDMYKSQRKEMTESKFAEYFEIVLKDKHSCPEHLAKDLAKTMLQGKKQVSEGDYAMVEIKINARDETEKEGESKGGARKDVSKEGSSKDKEGNDDAEESGKHIGSNLLFFKRIGNAWVRDTEIGEEAFMESGKLMCNLSKASCVSIGKTLEACVDEKQATQYFQNMLKSRVLGEFDKKMNESIDEMKYSLERDLKFLREQVEKQKKLKRAELYKPNNLMYRMGQSEKNNATDTSHLQSRYIDLRDMILSQPDFVKKQQDIVKFCAMYCRSALADKGEIEQWLYCKESNTKLFPRSLYKLAEAFAISSDEYNRVMIQLYMEVGTLSDDKDCIIDKYTNYKLNNVETREEENFDDNGFRIVTHGEMQDDETNQLNAALFSQEAQQTNTGTNVTQSSLIDANIIFDDETTQNIYNICTKLVKDIGVPIEHRKSVEERAIGLSKTMAASKIPSEHSYERKRAEIEKNTSKKSGMPPYTIFRDKMYIYLCACAVILAIQVSAPSIKITKTFSGCVRVLDGFPLGGMENMGTVKYMACILLKLVAKVRPWNSLEQIKTVETMTANVVKTMSDVYLKSAEIEEMLTRKRDYLAITPSEQIAYEEHAVEKWVQFMPPLISYSVEKSLQSVGSNFVKDLENMLKTGHKEQDIYLNVLKSKLLAHTYGIVEQINNVVKTKNLLLTTRSGIPFAENACCNDSQTVTTVLEYFKKEDGNIDNFIRRSTNMQTLLNNVKMLSKPAILYHPLATNIRYKKVPNEISEETVYSAIIHYCKLDKNIPIPPQFHGIMSSKIAGYNNKWSIEEKIGFLKRHGKVFGIQHLNTLMSIVNKQNQVHGISFTETPLNQINGLRNFLENMNTLDKTQIENNIIDAKLRHLLSNVLDDYKPTIIINQMRNSETALRKYLISMNGSMVSSINDFIYDHGILLDNKTATTLLDYVKNVDKWQLVDKDKEKDEYSSVFTIIQYMKSSIYSLTKMYPNKIIHNNVFTFSVFKHWKLSEANKTDLEELFRATYNTFEKFVGHPVAVKMLKRTQTYFSNLTLFIETMPTISSIYRNGTEFFSLMSHSTLLLLFKYCWLSVWYTYIIAFTDEELHQLDRELRVYNKRGVVDEMGHPNSGRKSIVVSGAIGDAGTIDTEYDNSIDIDEELNVSILRGVQKDANQLMAAVLVEFMRVEMKTKTLYNLSYSSFEKKIYKTKEDEKREITEYLGDMDDEERAVENMMKKFKLGRWSVGLDKGLYKYDKERYDKEREVMKMRLRDELAGNEFSHLFVDNLADSGIRETYDADELAKMEMDEHRNEYDIGMDEINIDAEFGGEFDDGDEGFDDYEEYEG